MEGEDIIGMGQPEKVKEGQLVEWPCENCKQVTHFEVPTHEVVNVKTYSAYHFPHQEPEMCEHCGQPHLFVLAPLGKNGMMFAFKAIAIQQGSRIITAPAGVIPNIRGGR